MHDAKLQLDEHTFCLLDSAGTRLLFTVRNLKNIPEYESGRMMSGDEVSHVFTGFVLCLYGYAGCYMISFEASAEKLSRK